MKKTFSDQFWVYPLVKMFLYFYILTRSPTINLEFFFIGIFIALTVRTRYSINWFHFNGSMNGVFVSFNKII